MPVIPFHDENPVQRTPFVTIGIIVLNVVALLYVQGLGDYGRREFSARHGFVPLRVRQLTQPQPVRVALYSPQEFQDGVLLPPDKTPFVDLAPNPREIYLSLITSLFLHAGVAAPDWQHVVLLDIRKQHRRSAGALRVFDVLSRWRDHCLDLPLVHA